MPSCALTQTRRAIAGYVAAVTVQRFAPTQARGRVTSADVVMAATVGPNGLTEKQEAFALAFLETGNAAEAYRRAYDVAPDAKDGWLYVEACQLLDNPKIALRLKELRDQAEKLSIFTLQAAMEEFEEARQAALREGQAAAAVSATTGKVKLFGLDRPTKIAAEHVGKNGGPIQVSAHDAFATFARLVGRHGAASAGDDPQAGGVDSEGKA